MPCISTLSSNSFQKGWPSFRLSWSGSFEQYETCIGSTQMMPNPNLTMRTGDLQWYAPTHSYLTFHTNLYSQAKMHHWINHVWNIYYFFFYVLPTQQLIIRATNITKQARWEHFSYIFSHIKIIFKKIFWEWILSFSRSIFLPKLHPKTKKSMVEKKKNQRKVGWNNELMMQWNQSNIWGCCARIWPPDRHKNCFFFFFNQ